MEKTCPMKEGHPSSHSQLLEGIYNFYDKKVNPIARANSTRACSDCLALTKLTWLFIQRKVGLARRVTLPSQKTLLAGSHL